MAQRRKYLDERNDIVAYGENHRDPIDVSLPKLPGYTFSTPYLRHDHKKANTLKYVNGYPIPVTTASSVIQHAAKVSSPRVPDGINGLEEDFADMELPSAVATPIPDYVRYDKKTLVFDAYFTEEVPNSATERQRFRIVKIYYHLEDDTITVIEPPIPNSGLVQGKLMKRQKIPKPSPEFDFEPTHYTWKDLNLGITVTFYSRKYRICSCGEFTSEWLASEGIELNPPECLPDATPIQEHSRHSRPPSVVRSRSRPRSSIVDEGRILRYYAVWDDRPAGGDLRPYVIHYYLSDGTMEVKEVNTPNAGREQFPLFLRRQRLVKNAKNVIDTIPGGMDETSEYFHEFDLGIGKTVFILNRPFFIYDCDESTRRYAADALGETNLDPIDITEPTKPIPERDLPPHISGIGTPEDSEQSCHSLQPTAPKKDYMKLVEFAGVVLCYEAFITNDINVDGQRVTRGPFLMKYFVADDTIEIHEQTNFHGLPKKSTKFLRRMKIPKPGHTSIRPCYYEVNDFKIGCTLSIFKNDFQITGTDPYVVRFARDHPEIFDTDTAASYEDHLMKVREEEVNKPHHYEQIDDIDDSWEPKPRLPYANEALILAPYPDGWNTEYKLNFQNTKT